ncbi:VOC family protein [Brachybacterium sp. AOP25-B2-12]|uniref:VOC family protein n=1 Tax=Brachybacterium sp. AOP25-B2-12 TaxID=3457710 RepID=UPI0040336B95
MTAPNLFLIHVRDTAVSAAFYSGLFEIGPTFTSPRYVAFEVAPGVLFAVWSGHGTDLDPAVPRTSEVGWMIPGPASAVDAVFARWVARGVRVVEEPHDAVFGRTFVVADPDGQLVRVSPVD